MNKFLMSCVAVVVVMFLAFAIPVPLAANGGSIADCYQGNSSPKTITTSPLVLATGATWASGEAHGSLGEIETERHSVVTDRGPAKVDIEFVANIDSTGTSTGRAEVKIKWLNTVKSGGVTETDFESGCVQEIDTAHQTGVRVGEAELELEGAATDFPGYKGTTKAAVLSIVVHEDPDNPGRIAVDFTIGLGYTCFENVFDGGDGDIELGKVTLNKLDPDEFKINNAGRHARWSFPDPFINQAGHVQTDCKD